MHSGSCACGYGASTAPLYGPCMMLITDQSTPHKTVNHTKYTTQNNSPHKTIHHTKNTIQNNTPYKVISHRNNTPHKDSNHTQSTPHRSYTTHKLAHHTEGRQTSFAKSPQTVLKYDVGNVARYITQQITTNHKKSTPHGMKAAR